MANNGNVPNNVRNPEQRLLSEYFVAKYPGNRHATRVPLGPAVEHAAAIHSPEVALRASRPWRSEADGMVWLNGELLLVEAKVVEPLRGLGKLPMYKALVPTTPELAAWRDWPVRMVLVTPRANDALLTMAASQGIEVDTFEPDWMTAYWEYRDGYWTAEHRRRRDAIKQARLAAGLE